MKVLSNMFLEKNALLISMMSIKIMETKANVP
jgi:hypothetical protein